MAVLQRVLRIRHVARHWRGADTVPYPLSAWNDHQDLNLIKTDHSSIVISANSVEVGQKQWRGQANSSWS